MDPQILGIDFQGPAAFESIITCNDLLLKNILKNLPFKDLLNCSLINQRWLHYSRAELRRRKCLALVTGSTIPPCHKLREFSHLLESIPAESIPFNGLRICSKYHKDNYEPDLAYHENNCKTISDFPGVLANCPVKYLRLCLDEFNCLSIHFIRLLLKTRGREIEHLSISNCTRHSIQHSLINSGRTPDPSNWLQNLRVLEINCEMGEDCFKEIVNGAPNLREIWGFPGPWHTQFFVGANKVDLVREFQLVPDEDGLEKCLEFARQRPKLQSLKVTSYFLNDPWALPKWFETLAHLMEGSAATLRDLEITHLDFLLLSTLDVPPMLYLRKLVLNYNIELARHFKCLSLQWINYSSLFPKLETVRLTAEFGLGGSHDFIPKPIMRSPGVPRCLQELLANLSTRGTQPCGSVCSLEVVNMNFGMPVRDYLEAIWHLFPAIRSVSVGDNLDLHTYLSFILGSKWSLENIALECKQHELSRKQLEQVIVMLCGMHPDERTQLASLDSNSLQKPSLVRIEHSLLNFECLKSLKITVRPVRYHAPHEPAVAALISDATRDVILAKFPWLKIDISMAH